MELRKQTEKIIKHLAPPHVASMESPSSFEDVIKQAKTGTYIVFEGGSLDTIFSGRETQYAYRAWHDSIHVSNGWDFSREAETMVAVEQQKIAVEHGVSLLDACWLKWDLILHVAHFYHHEEQHPENQTKMLEDFWEWIMNTSQGSKAFESVVPEWCEIEAEIFIANKGKY